MRLLLSGEINEDLFTKLIDFYNSLGEEKAEIYLNSIGGARDYVEPMVDVINENKEHTVVIGFGQLMSSAFDIFFLINSRKIILDGTIGMTHLSSICLSQDVKLVKDFKIETAEYLKDLEYDNAVKFKLYKSIGLTKTELNRIKKGEDVYFQYDRLSDLLKNN
jgi:ATP-dependent protease ClpP protease subunit